MRPPLNNDQLAAVGTRTPLTFVEAGPGAGKTTVAAERYGLYRFRRCPDIQKGVVAVSFTVAATGELRRRVRQRWGPEALRGSSRIVTIDQELTNILCLLLRCGHLTWPGGLTAIEPVDSNENHEAWKYNGRPKTWASWQPALLGKGVGVSKVWDEPTRIKKKDLLELLGEGHCTHEDVRRILRAALKDNELRNVVKQHRRETVSHFIVDEVFDADELDLDLIRLHCEASIPTTVVGDYWQALYEFREATPSLTNEFLSAESESGFRRFEVHESFRFVNKDLGELASALRYSPCELPSAEPESSFDVVIGRWWKHLWLGPAWIMPMSFGRVWDQTDALITLLADYVAHRSFGTLMRSRSEALLRLRIEADPTQQWPEQLGNISKMLVGTEASTAEEVLGQLRSIAPGLGAKQKVSGRRNPDYEARAVRKLQLLAARVTRVGPLVPGITAHQAKGKQWKSVGVCLHDDDIRAIEAGLDRNDADHRAIYVAITRASHVLGRVVGDPFNDN